MVKGDIGMNLVMAKTLTADLPGNYNTCTSTSYGHPPLNPAEYEICQRRGHEFGAWLTYPNLGGGSFGHCKWCRMAIRTEPAQPARIVEIGEPPEE